MNQAFSFQNREVAGSGGQGSSDQPREHEVGHQNREMHKEKLSSKFINDIIAKYLNYPRILILGLESYETILKF